MNAETLLLDAADVRKVVTQVGRDALMDALIARITGAVEAYDPDVARVPPRDGVQYDAPDWGLLEWMPAHFGAEGTMVKLVGYHPSNPEQRGVPTVISTICFFDARSGHLRALLDGTFLTALRTGAASAIASRVLAKQDSRTLGVIGCGAQAVTQIHALSRLYAFDEIIAYDRKHDVALTLAARIGFLAVPVTIVGRESLPRLVGSSDILCTCTSTPPGEGPVFEDVPHQPHLHINAVGSDFRGKFEVPVDLLRRSLVCPDFREQAVYEGECQQLSANEIGPDLRTLLQNTARYEISRSSPTVFDSTGWALEDYVAALMMFDYARELGVGRNVALECLSPDPKDPYSLLKTASQSVVAAVAASAPSSGRIRTG
jgi:ornithine cyclodeaminase/alanine dehydrogenase-like protein (mu-crystallin family)